MNQIIKDPTITKENGNLIMHKGTTMLVAILSCSYIYLCEYCAKIWVRLKEPAAA